MENKVPLSESYLSSSESSTSSDGAGIILETFCHQVGGRSLILTYDRETVCKPLVPQELRFYLEMPQSLLPFTPHYKGVIKVDVQVTDNEKIQLVTKTKASSEADVNDNVDQKDTDSLTDEDLEEKDEIPSNETKKESEKKAEGAINPWTFYCHGLHLEKLKETVKSRKQIDFILMEDVVSGFKFPCIMDLKMGDKMHKDYSNQEKYIKQAAKWNASTSKSLGLRIAGIQVYKDKSKKYVYLDKYYGFQLTEQSIKDEFIQFLHNGKQLRKKVVAAFIRELQKLYTCIKEQNDSRFYSSSLLLIYEGFEEQSATSEHLNGICDTSVNKPEEDQISEVMHPVNGICTGMNEDSIYQHIPESDPSIQQKLSGTRKQDGIMNFDLSTEKVGVKMIDFARSFHGRGKTTIDPCKDDLDKGPDDGYLLGLSSLINLLKDILMQN